MGTISRTHQHGRGYTLVELLVVLALLAMLAGMAVPRMFGVLGKSRIQQAAQQLAGELNNARLLAITHGCVYELRVSSDGSNYTIRPLHAADPGTFADTGQASQKFGNASQGFHASTQDNLSSSLPSQLDSDLSTRTSDSRLNPEADPTARPRPQPERIDGQLENGVVFDVGTPTDKDDFRGPFALPASGPTASTSANSLAGTDPNRTASGFTSTTGLDNVTWKPRAVFYPDGRSETTNVKLTGQDGRTVELAIRGLTGAVRIQSIQRAKPNQFDGASPLGREDHSVADDGDRPSDIPSEAIDATY